MTNTSTKPMAQPRELATDFDSSGWSSWTNAKRPNGVPLDRWAGEWDDSIMEALPDCSGLYEWGVKAPDSDMIVPVYVGKTGGLTSENTFKKRVPNYLRTGSHGGMQRKMHEYLKRGFSFYVRTKPVPSSRVEALEKRQLAKYDYAFNIQDQDKTSERDAILFTAKDPASYPQLTSRQQPDRRCKAKPTGQEGAAPTGTGRSRGESSWDIFRKTVKGHGLRREEISALYQQYKDDAQAAQSLDTETASDARPQPETKPRPQVPVQPVARPQEKPRAPKPQLKPKGAAPAETRPRAPPRTRPEPRPSVSISTRPTVRASPRTRPQPERSTMVDPWMPFRPAPAPVMRPTMVDPWVPFRPAPAVPGWSGVYRPEPVHRPSGLGFGNPGPSRVPWNLGVRHSVSANPTGPLKKDGTPDMRFKSNWG
jgi:hypothetical protein